MEEHFQVQPVGGASVVKPSGVVGLKMRPSPPEYYQVLVSRGGILPASQTTKPRPHAEQTARAATKPPSIRMKSIVFMVSWPGA